MPFRPGISYLPQPGSHSWPRQRILVVFRCPCLSEGYYDYYQQLGGWLALKGWGPVLYLAWLGPCAILYVWGSSLSLPGLGTLCQDWPMLSHSLLNIHRKTVVQLVCLVPLKCGLKTSSNISSARVYHVTVPRSGSACPRRALPHGPGCVAAQMQHPKEDPQVRSRV